MLRKLLTMVLIAVLILALSVTAYAQDIDPDRWCSFTATFIAQDVPMEGAEFNIYYVAESTVQEDNRLTYAYTEFFADCGIPLEDPELARKLSDYAATSDVPTEVLTTDENGRIGYEELPFGLYLLRHTGAVEGYSTCAPFLLTLPMVTDTEVIYDVDASPKTEVFRLTDITVKKVWLADNTVKIPAGVTVELLQGEEVIETAVLNAENNWQITYTNLPRRDDYSIREVNVPRGFHAVYGQDGYEFTVYNTAALAQTGQTVWPIPVLAAAGLLLLVIGFVLLRKQGRGHA